MRLAFSILIFVAMSCCQAFASWVAPGGFSVSKTFYTTLSYEFGHSSEDLSYTAVMNANLSDRDYGLESFVFSSVDYEDGPLGVRYAPFESLGFGYGLLINDLNTRYYQPSFLQNEHSGLKVDYDFDNFTFEGIGTYQHLYGMKINDIAFFGLNVGFEYLSDTRMESAEGFGRSAVGAFMELPLTDEFSLFAESAQSSNGGEGTLAGAAFDYDLLFAFSKIKVAAASFNDKFIPGYFTTGYDLNPVDFSSLECASGRRYGTVASIDTGIMGFVSLYLLNESYADGGSANSGRVLIIPIERVMITGFVKEMSFSDLRPIKGKDANFVGASVNYKTRFGFSASVNYLKTPFGEDMKPYDTSYLSLGFEF